MFLGPRRSEEDFASPGIGAVSLWLALEPVALGYVSNSFGQFLAMRKRHCCRDPNRKEGHKELCEVLGKRAA